MRSGKEAFIRGASLNDSQRRLTGVSSIDDAEAEAYAQEVKKIMEEVFAVLNLSMLTAGW